MTGWVCAVKEVITPPQSEPLELSDVIDYTKASSSDSRRLTTIAIGCRIDLENRLGRALTQQTLRCTYQCLLSEMSIVLAEFQFAIKLYFPPIGTVTLVETLLDANTWQTIDTTLWHQREGSVLLDDVTKFYSVDGYINCRITYDVGSAVLAPEDKLMLLQYVAHKYMYSEDDTVPEGFKESLFRNKEWVL